MNVIVGIADMKVSDKSEAILVTHSLGSCIGLTVYDPVAKVGGMLHYMLPDSELDAKKAGERPFMFANTRIPRLFKGCYELGAEKKRMVVKVAGGAQIMDPTGRFNIGKRNYAALRKIFWKNNVLINNEDVGGNCNRTVWLKVDSGEVTLKVSGKGICTL